MEFEQIKSFDELKNNRKLTFFKMELFKEPDRKVLQDLCIEISKHTPDAQPNNDEDEKNEGRKNPYVGAILVKDLLDGKFEVFGACRSALHNGEHGECGLLNHILGEYMVDGCEMYVTLEPCTQESRHEWTEPCCEIISNRRIRKVNIGMLDPNPDVAGNGIRHLISKNVEVELFDWDKQQEVIKLNKDFAKQFEGGKDPRIFKKINNSISDYLSIDAVKVFMDFNEEECKTGLGKDRAEDTKFSFFNMMIKNKSIVDSKSKFLPFDVNDDFALFFYKKPFHQVDGATIHYVDSLNSNDENETIENLSDFCNIPYSFAFEACAYKENNELICKYEDGPELGFVEKIGQVYGKKMEKDKEKLNKIGKEFLKSKFGHNAIEIVREAFINALIHRDYKNNMSFTKISFYSDRITIENPIYKEIAEIKDIKKKFIEKNVPSHIVNPKLMRFFMLSNMCERKNNGFKSFEQYDQISFKLNDENVLTTTLVFK